MSGLLQDLRYAVHMLAKSPGFTSVAVLTLALGIGANTAIFSVIDAMLLRELPVRNPEELVEFVRLHPDGAMMSNLPYIVLEHFQKKSSVLAGVIAFTSDTRVFRATARGTEQSVVHEVSGPFFTTLGVTALIGREINPTDDCPGAANQVAVLSYPFWSQRFGRDPSAVGTTVHLSGIPYTVIGVMGPSFYGVDPSRLPDMWVPLASDPNPGEVWVLGRLKPGISIPQARAQLEPLFLQALGALTNEMTNWPAHDREEFLGQKLIVNRATTGTSGFRWQYWEYSNTLKILLGMTGLVLLISCGNLASLLVARSAARSREIGIRQAIGASRWHIVRQLLTENLFLALLGGGAGLLVAAWGHRLLVMFLLANEQSTPLTYQLNGRILGFSLAISILTGLLSGVLPAFGAVRRDIVAITQNVSSLQDVARLPLARKLLIFQVALSLALLIGAGLLVRTLRNLATTELGLAHENLVLMTVDPSASKSVQDWKAFWSQLTERLAVLPGVLSVSLAGDAVFGRGGWNETIWVPQGHGGEQYAQVADNLVGPGFFETVGIPVLAGREFREQDQGKSPRVAVVNREFARKFFNDENPIGQHFGDRGPGSSNLIEIVGVVGNAKYRDVREVAPPMFYQPLAQNLGKRSYEVHARTVGNPATVSAEIRGEIERMDQDVSVYDVRTIDQVIHRSLQHDRMFALLASAFGLLALVLTSVGVYGLVAHQVARRTAEIGLRMALGAERHEILWMAIRESLILVLAGIVLGVPAAWLASRLISSMLYGLTPHDPTTIVGAAFLILVITGLAAFFPARRAARVDPNVALRYE
ncbi:MAG TPA: ABC transporter permease [Candidatus Limnocylindrales bacterium]|nr:ABC transporter permease [Candidatus Limnocylindrales bacterium]